MDRRHKAAQKRKIAVSVFVACLCVISLVFSEALQQRIRVTRVIAPADVQGVAEIAKSFSFSFSIERSPRPKIVNLAAENLTGPDSLSTESAGVDEESLRSEELGTAAAWLTTTGIAPDRANRFFFKSSLPTFAQSRSTISSKNLWAANAARYLDTSFGALMDSVFKHGDDAAFVPDLSRQGQDVRNPFTEAKLKEDAEAAPAAAHTPPSSTPPAKETPPPTNQNAGTAPSSNQQPPAGGSIPQNAPPEGPFLVLGDFSGTGMIEARSATRVDDGTFAFSDGLRTFSLYINPAATEFQRSFAIDDFNQDGIADLIVTSRAALLGAVLFGDGDGNYRVADTFVTGYEPTVPVPAGLSGTGYRDILTVNVRTGWIETFRRTDSYRMIRGQAGFTFSPDFVARITNTASGADCIMAAQSGDSAVVYQWQNDGMLAPSGENLPQAPSASINKDFLQDNALSRLQIYQVGSGTSVMLTNSHGASFSVANFRTFPNIFVMVGDVSKQGTLDVAVAYLLPAR